MFKHFAEDYTLLAKLGSSGSLDSEIPFSSKFSMLPWSSSSVPWKKLRSSFTILYYNVTEFPACNSEIRCYKLECQGGTGAGTYRYFKER